MGGEERGGEGWEERVCHCPLTGRIRVTIFGDVGRIVRKCSLIFRQEVGSVEVESVAIWIHVIV